MSSRRSVPAALVATAGLAVGSGFVGIQAWAFADSPACVSRAEYHQVQHGWTRRHVQRVFDVEGRKVDGFAGGFTKAYRGCGSGWRVYVSYVGTDDGCCDGPQAPFRLAEKRRVHRG